MKIIFIRHGIAEDRDLEVEDKYRELTEEGIMELEDNFPFLGKVLMGKRVRLITSHLSRAIETSEILSDCLDNVAIEKMKFVETGNISTLKEMVRKSKSLYDYLVIVGHNPFINDWILEITSTVVNTSKGSINEVEITDYEEFQGRVNYSLGIDKYKKLIDFDSFKLDKEKFQSDIEAKVEECINLILNHREIYIKEPQEIESVHKLRVKIRQFRSLVSFFKPLMSKKTYRNLQGTLRTMAQECAYLRELDVLMKEWKSHKDEFIKNSLSGEVFLNLMKEERYKEQNRLLEYIIRPEFYGELMEVKDTLLKSLSFKNIEYISLNDMVLGTLNKWYEIIKRDYEAIEENNLIIIHTLRIKAKKMRYISEIFGLDKEPDTKERYQEVKKWQEVIGDICDANRNSEAVLEIRNNSLDNPNLDEIDEEIKVFNGIQNTNADELYMDFFGKKSHEVDLYSSIEDDKLQKVEGTTEEITEDKKEEV